MKTHQDIFFDIEIEKSNWTRNQLPDLQLL